jgi:hypothetical protein
MNTQALRPQASPPLVEAARNFYQREPILTAVAAILLAMMIPSFAGLLIDTRTFNGINVWIKPLKFQSSGAIFLLTLALFWPYLDAKDRARKGVRLAARFVSIVLLLEIAYITYRASQAEGSHFNNATLRDEILYALMGIGILSSTIVSGWFGWLMLRARDAIAAPDLRFAIGIGLIAGVILGSLTGAYMSSQPGHWVGGVQSDLNGSFFFGWSRTGGDLRVAHFAGLHAMQGIPLVGWFASRYAPGKVRPIVLAATIVWTVVTAATFIQAIMGRALFPL